MTSRVVRTFGVTSSVPYLLSMLEQGDLRRRCSFLLSLEGDRGVVVWQSTLKKADAAG